jgi:WD40 repeat protein
VGNTDFNLIRAFEAQNAPVTAVAFGPDGERVAIGSAAGEVRVYNVSDGERLSTMEGDAVGVYALAFHPNGKQLAAAGFEGEVRLFEPESGDLIRSFTPVPLEEAGKRAEAAANSKTSG